MKRIGFVGAAGTMALAMLAPAAASATSHAAPPFWAQLTKAGCGNRGGQYGFGKVVIGMRGWAHNDVESAPTPNYIRVVTWYQQKIDGVWADFDVATATSQTYPDGHLDTFQAFLQSALSFRSADHPLTRMRVRAEFWDDLPSGDVLLGKVSARTAAC